VTTSGRRSWRILLARSRFAWVVLIACLLVTTSAVGWLTQAAWRADQSRQQALLDSEIRNALWRLDSWAAPLLAIESNRPSLSTPFTGSPRLAARLVQGYIVRDAEGCWSWRRLATATTSEPLPEDSVFCKVDWQKLLDAGRGEEAPLPTAENPELSAGATALDDTYYSGLVEWPATLDNNNYLLNPLSNNERSSRSANLRNTVDAQEQVNRTRVVQQFNQIGKQTLRENPVAKEELHPLQPLWVGHELVLARFSDSGRKGAARRLEICWLNWSEWKRLLAEQVQELEIDVQISPADDGESSSGAGGAAEWQMASLPVRVEPLLSAAGAGIWPIPFLGVWVLLFVVGLTVIALMHQTLVLSERRAAFVSAVTHELRTPLTTFRLYTEMLSEGIATDPRQQQSYFDTLAREANRLTHLVENVLAYARLEHGRPTARNETLTVGELLERSWPRLQQRVTETPLQLQLEIDDATRHCRLITNALAIEQILFNLIDNACKYARDAADSRVICRAWREGGQIVLQVMDFGPGLNPAAERTLFKPFRKSSAQAAESAPGIGLGL
jgi:signal transduction histidine kinase